jgi:5-(carboxyamino)imidazole ribonucleotide synthase
VTAENYETDRAPVVGMVGAGQLARMTTAAAVGLGIEFRVLAAAPDESAAQVCAGTVLGDYRSADDLLKFAARCDVVTFDHEHVPPGLIAAMEQAGTAVRPGGQALRYAQDKLAMREKLAALGVACPRFAPVSDLAGVTAFAAAAGWPVVLKAVSGGYDGRGVWVCANPAEAAQVLEHGIAAGRGVRPVPPRAGHPGRPVAEQAGRRLPRGPDRPGRRDLP